MFCEGFYLHRLIVRAFEIPKSLIIYYFIGIGECSKLQNYHSLYLFLSIIYYFIGIGQWSTSYYKTTFSYIIQLYSCFCLLKYSICSLNCPFYRQHWEKTKWYRPFLDYTILVSFKREFLYKNIRKHSNRTANKFGIFLFNQWQFIARNISF